MISCFYVDISSITCTWKFIGEEGSRFFIIGEDIIFKGPASLGLKNDDGNYDNMSDRSTRITRARARVYVCV